MACCRCTLGRPPRLVRGLGRWHAITGVAPRTHPVVGGSRAENNGGPLLLIANGQMLEPTGRPVRGDVLVDGDCIARSGPTWGPPDAVRLDAAGKLVLPGLINAHTHAHHNLIKGDADGVTWNSSSTPAPALPQPDRGGGIPVCPPRRGRDAQDRDDGHVRPVPGPARSVARGHRGGGTRLLGRRHCASWPRALATSSSTRPFPGLMAAIPEPLRKELARRRPARPIPPGVVREALRSIAARRGPGASRGGADDPGHCTDAFLRESVRLAKEFGVGVHTHLAESKVQALSGRSGTGRARPAASTTSASWDRAHVAHAIWIDADDIALWLSGTSIVHNPASNMKIGSGIAPVAEIRARGQPQPRDGRLGSSDNQNMFEALRFAALLSKVRSPDYPDWLTAAQVLRMATTGGAQALGLSDRLGRVAPGYLADLVLVRLDSMYLRPLNDVTHQLVYFETGAPWTRCWWADRSSSATAGS